MTLTRPSPSAAARSRATDVKVVTIDANGRTGSKPDFVVTEEPMEIRVGAPGKEPTSFAVTMRTPGHDFELAVGFLLTEGMINSPGDVNSVKYCQLKGDARQDFNIVTVGLGRHVEIASSRRAMVTSSSCGICGTASLEQLATFAQPLQDGSGPQVSASVLVGLPDAVRKMQPTFDRTGGLHAAALFDPQGTIDVVREDIGRHNAVDKVIGNKVLANTSVLSEFGLFCSGRLSFEIIQKAIMARIALIAGVGAPSNLAVQTADALGITLVGFLRDGTANIYSHKQRVLF